MSAFVQKPAPAFTAQAVMPGGEFKDVSLSDFKGQWVILLFYPLDFTFVCPTELVEFSDAMERFNKINTTVLGISTDSAFSHLAWVQRPRSQGGLGPEMKLPLVADKSLSIAKDYGVLLEKQGIALRGLFIIDPNGIVRQVTVNDLPVGRSAAEAIRLVEAFQFVEEHGEACPAGWNKGARTIKADPKGSLEYFAAAHGEKTNGNGESNKRPRLV
ncbi:hypothetical protein CP532_0819 [Ophiocordyceps camponoti-leonardi (nom. inval.)]|nr:hypothetical protein CP532_0819 [Ophiocordyceps camponoti-leonardi (nom. inval.)]